MAHPSKDVNAALVRLLDALCEWERNTGNESVLILRSNHGFVMRAQSGKPLDESRSGDLTDADLMGPLVNP